MKPSEKRRKYPLVRRSYQLYFLALVLGYMLALTVFMGGFMFVPDFVRMQDPELDLLEKARIAEEVLILHGRLWPALLALICLIGLHSFRVFHRFVGPLVRFEQAFNCVREGDLQCRVHLRRKDFMREEEKHFNEMVAGMETHIQALDRAARNARHDCGVLEAHWKNTGPPLEPGHPLEVLRRRLDTLTALTGHFKFGKGVEESPPG